MLNRQIGSTKHQLVCTKSTTMTNKHKQGKSKCSDDSDSDGAPEEMTFKEGLEKMLETKRNISKKLEEEKERLRQKRKRHEELFIEQKKQKLAKLESMKLPEDFLENIDDKPKKISRKSEKIENDNKEEEDEEDDDMNANDDVNMDGDEEGDEEEQDEDDGDDDIEEGKTGIIAIHSVPKKKTTPAFERAQEFKMKALFGPSAKRQTMKAYLGMREKRKFRK